MHITTTTHRSDGTFVAHTYEVRRLRNALAFWIAARDCACRRDSVARFCLLDPPAWTLRVGLGWRFSLGSAMWAVAQWAYRYDNDGRVGQELVASHTITRDDAIRVYGWSREALDREIADLN